MPEQTKTEAQTLNSDITAESWIFRIAPISAKPYLTLTRIDRPIGTWLLLIPCWWGLAYSDRVQLEDYVTFGSLFAIGAFVMRAAGCIWNDILDRNYDARVARTSMRPIANGKISVYHALILMTFLAFIGLLVLIQFNKFCVILGISSISLIAVYPLMKRFTYWPQAWLGLTFNWGALVGWASASGSIELTTLIIYAGGIFWTLGYDTIYAHQDKEDDILIGVHSTALLFGYHTKFWLGGFYIAALSMFIAVGIRIDLNYYYYVGIGIGALQLTWQVFSLKMDNPADCLYKFKSNKWLGLLILLSIVAGKS